MRYMTVRVVDASGKPRSNTRVGIYIHQALASGMADTVYTDSNGEADFTLDVDEYAEIGVYVDGNEKIRREKIKATYHVVV